VIVATDTKCKISFVEIIDLPLTEVIYIGYMVSLEKENARLFPHASSSPLEERFPKIVECMKAIMNYLLSEYCSFFYCFIHIFYLN